MKKILLLLSVIVLCILCISCEKKKEYSGTVMIYSSLSGDELQSLKESFEAKYPTVTVDYYFSDSDNVIDRLENEAMTGQINADIVIFKKAEDLDRFRLTNLLADYKSKKMKKNNEREYIGNRLGLLKDCMNEENGKLLIDFLTI